MKKLCIPQGIIKFTDGVIGKEDTNGSNVASALATISTTEATVLAMKYWSHKVETNKEIGRRLGVSGGRIFQIHKKAISKLRHPVRMKILFGQYT